MHSKWFGKNWSWWGFDFFFEVGLLRWRYWGLGATMSVCGFNFLLGPVQVELFVMEEEDEYVGN